MFGTFLIIMALLLITSYLDYIEVCIKGRKSYYTLSDRDSQYTLSHLNKKTVVLPSALYLNFNFGTGYLLMISLNSILSNTNYSVRIH